MSEETEAATEPANLPEVARILHIPPAGTEDRAPALANFVDVDGGTDTLVLTFYHISPSTKQQVFGYLPDGRSIERHGDTVVIRSEPIARIALSLTTTLEMLGDIVPTLVGGIPEVQDVATNIMTRVADAMAQAEKLKQTGGASGGDTK